MNDGLQAIESLLDRIDLAIVENRLDALTLPEWRNPSRELQPEDGEQLRRLLERIQGTIARVEEAKAETAGALDELRRRRHAVRAYSS